MQKFLYPCTNSKEAEKNILVLFNEKFIRRNDYGLEFFEGNLDDMVKTVTGFFTVK